MIALDSGLGQASHLRQSLDHLRSPSSFATAYGRGLWQRGTAMARQSRSGDHNLDRAADWTQTTPHPAVPVVRHCRVALAGTLPL
jgi:hypothetical protein